MAYPGQSRATILGADLDSSETESSNTRRLSVKIGDRNTEWSPSSGSGALSGRTALVTGAGGGIGRAIAAELSALGAEVVLVGRRREALKETADEMCGRGSAAHVVPADLTKTEDVQALVGEVSTRWTGLDALVHCAGAYGRGAMTSTSVAELDRLYEANVRAPYRLTQHMLPMLMGRHGYVVFVNSTQGLNASGGVGQFAATQHGLRAVADSLRDEVNAFGVRVVTLHVGRTATERQREIYEHEGRDYRPELLLQPSDIALAVAGCLMLPPTAEITTLTIRPALKSY